MSLGIFYLKIINNFTNLIDGKLNKDDIYKTVSALTDQTEQGQDEDPESEDKLETEKVFG